MQCCPRKWSLNCCTTMSPITDRYGDREGMKPNNPEQDLRRFPGAGNHPEQDSDPRCWCNWIKWRTEVLVRSLYRRLPNGMHWIMMKPIPFTTLKELDHISLKSVIVNTFKASVLTIKPQVTLKIYRVLWYSSCNYQKNLSTALPSLHFSINMLKSSLFTHLLIVPFSYLAIPYSISDPLFLLFYSFIYCYARSTPLSSLYVYTWHYNLLMPPSASPSYLFFF